MGKVTARTIYTYESQDGLFELPIKPAGGFEDDSIGGIFGRRQLTDFLNEDA